MCIFLPYNNLWILPCYGIHLREYDQGISFVKDEFFNYGTQRGALGAEARGGTGGSGDLLICRRHTKGKQSLCRR